MPLNPSGATKEGESIDGALPSEMRRGGSFRFPPKRTEYPWGGLAGAVVQAEILSRQGYDAWSWSDRALRRATEFLRRARQAVRQVVGDRGRHLDPVARERPHGRWLPDLGSRHARQEHGLDRLDARRLGDRPRDRPSPRSIRRASRPAPPRRACGRSPPCPGRGRRSRGRGCGLVRAGGLAPASPRSRSRPGASDEAVVAGAAAQRVVSCVAPSLVDPLPPASSRSRARRTRLSAPASPLNLSLPGPPASTSAPPRRSGRRCRAYL